MKILTKRFLATTAFALALPAMASADLPGPLTNIDGGITEAEIRDGLMELGYTDITYIAGAGSEYTVRAHYNGRYVPLKIDTETGAISQQGLPDHRTISIGRNAQEDDIAAALRELGYSNIEVGPKQGQFRDVDAWRYGEDVMLTVDLETGRVENKNQDHTWYVAMSDGMSMNDVKTELEALGYSDVRALTSSGNHITGAATFNGEPVSLAVNAGSGEVMAWVVEPDS